jgi:hypothetical protein
MVPTSPRHCEVFIECATIVGGILLILGVALGFTNYLVDAEVPSRLIDGVQMHVQSKYLFLLLLNIALLVVYLRWKISKLGAGDFIAAPQTSDHMHFALAAQAWAGMVHVPSNDHFAELIDFIGVLHYKLPAFDIDKYEVTNAQYQDFVDQGGYRKPEYWKEKFIKDGKELSWRQAVDLFRDPTGRPAPSTWEGGHFPVGQANVPVSGVSWYEAAAYAVFAGKSLPTIGLWYQVAPADLAAYSVNQSNFNG